MNNSNLREDVIRISGVNPKKCMKCGKCSATCPAYGEMEYHPHQFVGMIADGDVETLLKSDSIYKCLSCFACVERCPRGVEPAKLIESIRLEVIRKKEQNHLKPNDIPSLIDDDVPQQAIVSAFRKYTK